MKEKENNYPKLHNATWPGIVGKGPDSEPPIPFDTMLEMTATAEVDGVKFDGVDIGLFEPHIDIDSSDDGIKRLAEKVSSYNLEIGTLVAPIWGGPAMGSKEDRALFVEQVRSPVISGKYCGSLVFVRMGLSVSIRPVRLRTGLKILLPIQN